MRKFPLLFFALLAGCSAISFRGGPAKSQIKKDLASSFESCMQPLRNANQPYAVIDAMKITSTKIYNNEATVLVRVEYHWPGTPASTATFPAPPCSYFNAQSAKNLAQPRLIYRLSGSNWKLAEIL